MPVSNLVFDLVNVKGMWEIGLGKMDAINLMQTTCMLIALKKKGGVLDNFSLILIPNSIPPPPYTYVVSACQSYLQLQLSNKDMYFF